MDKTRGTQFFYGWVITAAGFSIFAMLGGGLWYSYGVFFPVMMEDLGFSRGAGATAVSMMILTQGLTSPLIGALISKVGLKRVMIAGSLLMISTMLLMSRVTALWHIYLIYGIAVGIAILSAGFLPLMTMMNNWFARRRSLAISISISGVGVGVSILAPLCGYLIEAIGWRETWLVLAGFATVFALLPVIFLVKAKPEDIGQTVDGIQDEVGDEKAVSLPASSITTDWETKAALKTPIFWLIGIIGAINMFTLSILATHQVAHLQDIGISPVTAASALGFLVGTSILGRLAGGVLGDRFQPRYIVACAFAMQAAALIIFLNARVLALIYLYVVVFGLAYGALLVLFPAIIGNYYGRKNYSTIFGFSAGVVTLVGATGPAFAGFAFDLSGSYTIPLVTATILVAASGICALLARPPRAASQITPSGNAPYITGHS